jgi:hypothetical protein
LPPLALAAIFPLQRRGRSMPAFLPLLYLAQAAAPAAAPNVAFCFVRDAPHHDYLTPAAPEGTQLDARFAEWLKATLPAVGPETLKSRVACQPSIPRSVYDHWFGWTRLSSGDVLSEAFDWPADWYRRRPPAHPAPRQPR